MRRTAIGKPLYYFMAVCYVIIIAITFYSDSQLPKIASMMVIPPAILLFLVFADFDRLRLTAPYGLWMIAGIMMVYVLSAIVWVINIEENIYIIHGSTRIAFQLINVLVAMSAVYIFGSEAVDLTFYGAIAMNTLRLVQGVAAFGPAKSIQDLIHAITTGEQQGFMARMEIQVVSYVYGLFIFYYLFIHKGSVKKRVIHVALAVWFMVLGFKRIIFASVFLSVVLGLVWYKIKPEKRNKYCMFIGICVMVFSFAYIPFIRYGLFEKVMNLLNVETNTRIDIYNFMKSTYEVRPDFIGHGVDFVTRYLQYLKTIHLKYKGSSLDYIHNDILVHYIEMGFFGFLGWLYGNCIWFQKWFAKNYGRVCAQLYAIVNLYSFVNFSVGNTSRAYAVRLSVAVVLLGAAYLYKGEGYTQKETTHLLDIERKKKDAVIRKAGKKG